MRPNRQKIDALISAGLKTLLVPIDGHSLDNRGLKGVGERIRVGIGRAKKAGIPTIASVTLSKLACVAKLPILLEDLGFDAAAFSYPRREPFGSTSMVYSDQSELIDFKPGELAALLDDVKALKRRFRVPNPTAGSDDEQMHAAHDRPRIGLLAAG